MQAKFFNSTGSFLPVVLLLIKTSISVLIIEIVR